MRQSAGCDVSSQAIRKEALVAGTFTGKCFASFLPKTLETKARNPILVEILTNDRNIIPQLQVFRMYMNGKQRTASPGR